MGVRPGALRGLVFDMGGVLYDPTPWRRWLLRVLGRLGVHADYDNFYQSWDQDYLVDVHRGRRQYTEAFQAFLIRAGLSWAQVDEVEAASHVRQQELEAGTRALPGVNATAAALAAAGMSLGVLTDAPHPAARLVEKLDRLGLGRHFQNVLSSFDLEATKPAAICYHSAVEALGLLADEVAFVSHDARDLGGAAAAGLKTVALNCTAAGAADFHVRRFSQILELVEAHVSRPLPC